MKWRKIAMWLVALLVVGSLTVWFTTSLVRMKPADAYSVNDPALSQRLLIASQGSGFKDKLVQEVVRELQPLPLFIQVIDIGGLKEVKEEEWTAIVIIHTVEYWKPPKPVLDFVDRSAAPQKLIVLSTSGEGSFKLDGVDGISSASKMEERSGNAEQILKKVRALLKSNDLAKRSNNF